MAAIKFARNGNRVFAGVRNLKKNGVKNLRDIAMKEKLLLEIIELDVASDKSVDEAVKKIYQKTKRVDILINNAGFGYIGPIENFSIKEIKKQYETNVFGTLRMIKSIVPVMRKQKSGLIINLSSINGVVPFPLYAAYSSSKFAIESLSEILRFELNHFGIKVVIVEPGTFTTNFSNNVRYPKEMNSSQSPYKQLTDGFFGKFSKAKKQLTNNFLSRLFNPDRVVNLFYQVSRSDHPNLRYLIGLDAHLYYFVKKMIPDRLWYAILRRIYHW